MLDCWNNSAHLMKNLLQSRHRDSLKTRAGEARPPTAWVSLLPQRSYLGDQRSERGNPSGFCIDIFPECMFEGEYVRVRDDSGEFRAELVGQIPRSNSG